MILWCSSCAGVRCLCAVNQVAVQTGGPIGSYLARFNLYTHRTALCSASPSPLSLHHIHETTATTTKLLDWHCTVTGTERSVKYQGPLVWYALSHRHPSVSLGPKSTLWNSQCLPCILLYIKVLYHVFKNMVWSLRVASGAFSVKVFFCLSHQVFGQRHTGSNLVVK